MTQEQIEKAKNDYAQSIIDSFGRSGVPCGISDIRGMIADGFKAGAQHALSLQWVSVAERLPEEENQEVLIMVNGKTKVAHFDKQTSEFEVIVAPSWREICRPKEISHWLPIPPLNPEKEERL